MVMLAQPPYGLFAAAASEPLDLGGLQAAGQAPAMAGPAAAVDDIGEILEAIRGHRMRLPAHAPSRSRPGDTRPVRPKQRSAAGP
jgi:hypothetical protein